MTQLGQNVTMWRGDTVVLRYSIVDDAGADVALDGGSARWWAGKDSRATGSRIVLQKTASITGNVITVTINPADTATIAPGIYYCECEAVNSAGIVATVAVGNFTLKSDVVR